MDAITLLRNDHKTVDQLFKRFEKAGDRAYAEKRNIVDRIIEELSIHAAVEERFDDLPSCGLFERPGDVALLAPGERALAVPLDAGSPTLAVGDRVDAFAPATSAGRSFAGRPPWRAMLSSSGAVSANRSTTFVVAL